MNGHQDAWIIIPTDNDLGLNQTFMKSPRPEQLSRSRRKGYTKYGIQPSNISNRAWVHISKYLASHSALAEERILSVRRYGERILGDDSAGLSNHGT